MKQQQKKLTFAELLELRRYNPNVEPEPETPFLIIGNKIIGHNQNIVTLQAKQKAGKTTFFTAIAASALSRREVFTIQCRLPEHKKRMAYFDTEQGKADFYKTIRRMKSLAAIGTFPAHFDAFNMREDNPNDIIGAINEYCNIYKDCGLLMIDNSTDLLNSFNDEAESKIKIQHFKKWSKQNDNLIVHALHTGRTGDNTLGHFGAFSDRASQSVLAIEKTDRGTITMKPKYLRSDADFDPVEVTYNTAIHNWEQTFYIANDDAGRQKNARQTPQEYDIQEHRSRLSYIFNSQPTCDHDYLVKGITELYGVPKQWAKESIRYFLQEKLFYKTPDGYTCNQQGKFFA